MSGIIVPPSEGRKRELIPVGTHMARCYKMLHIGTYEDTFEGQPKVLNKVRIGFELPQELVVFKEENGPQPLVIEKKFTLSLHEKASLRAFLKAWRGKDFTPEEVKGFDITRLIGAPCLLSIIHKTTEAGKTYEEITSVSPLMKGQECPPAILTPEVLTYTDWNEQLFQKQPQFIKDEIMRTDEYKAMNFVAHDDAPIADNVQDDLPF